MRILAIMSLLAANISSSLAEEPLSMKHVTSEQEFIFLSGAAQGIACMNTQLFFNHMPQVYCAPWDYVLNAKELRRLADSKLMGPHESQLFIVAAIDVLAKQFPCR